MHRSHEIARLCVDGFEQGDGVGLLVEFGVGEQGRVLCGEALGEALEWCEWSVVALEVFEMPLPFLRRLERSFLQGRKRLV